MLKKINNLSEFRLFCAEQPAKIQKVRALRKIILYLPKENILPILIFNL